MIRVSTALTWAVLSLISCLLGGCVPAGDVQVDEQKDPHYQRGRTMVSNQDFKGAVDEFEKALEANPRSASAHFQLGWLCEEKTKDYAEAIYHYRKHLALQPNSEDANKAQDHLKVCMGELAKAEYSQPNTQNLQRDIDRFTAENIQLKLKIENMRTQYLASVSALANAQQALANSESQRASIADALSTAKASLAARATAVSTRDRDTSYPPAPSYAYQPETSTSSTPPARPHVHIVRSRETIAGIAQQYGIKKSTLLAANPRVDPRRLRVGQVLKIP